MSRSIVVIGGGAAGGTAAQFAKKTDRKADVTIFEREKYPQYSKCALPHFISGRVSDVIEFSEDWFRRAGINLYLETEVKEVDINRRIVVAEKEGEKIEKKFDSLIISTGAKSGIPPIRGIYDDENTLKRGIFVLRTLDDAIKIRDYLNDVENISIVGAGLIGLELAESFYEKGKRVKVIEILPSILPAMLDPDMSEIVYSRIKDNIEIFTEYKVNEIKGRDTVSSIVIEGRNGEKKEFDTEMVVIATGVRADVEIAKKIGCKIGETGGILVDRRAMTSIRDVYAAGDCTEYRDLITKKPIPVGLGSIGVRQAIVAGINAAGGKAELPSGFLQTRTSEIFGIEMAAVGPVSRSMEGITIGKYTGRTLPHYFPGGQEIVIKIMVNQDGRIVAAQSVGKGSALRINTITCAIYNGMKVDEFSRIETAYAPPIAPTLDPMLIASDVARFRYERRK